jgi:NAD(P)-dependent dehydrogenase (short-subunit alcohol dehydrogenase family)
VVVASASISNGIGWNVAADTMYLVDSARRRLEAEPDECRRTLAEAGPVDVPFNNAAILFRTPLEEFTVEAFDRTVAVNLRAVTRSFAQRYGPAGVTANAVAPGGVETEMTASIGPEIRAGYVAEIPAVRFCSPAEVGSVVAFVAGNAASFVNGATLDVNGGWFMG